MVVDDMVLQRRLDYGFNGYQVPPTPRATRSVRRRSSFKKKTDDNPMCAFDLLATVAGKLLVEGDNSPCSIDALNVKKEQHTEDNNNDNNALKLKPSDQGSCNMTYFVSDIVKDAPVVDQSVKEICHAQKEASSGFASALTYSDSSEKVGSASKLIEHRTFATKPDVGPPFGCKLEENKTGIKIEPQPNIFKVLNRFDKCSSEENSVKFTSGSPRPGRPFPAFKDDVKLVRDDDDENSSGCTQPSTTLNNDKAFSPPPPRVGDQRIRKIVASKYWKVAPKLKDEEHFTTDAEEMKTISRNRNNCYKRQRSLRDYPFKKRKLFDRGALESNSDEGALSCDAISCSPGKGSNVGSTHGATAPASTFGAIQHASSFQPRDSHVKLKIKSFRVPELFVDIPETATVGSLKKTVLEAVTAILNGGLKVGVLLQGKKIRDDNKTLLQTGISHNNNKLDSLGFTLEPNPSLVPHPLQPKEHPFLLPCESPKPLNRYPPATNVVQKIVQQGNLKSTSADSPLMHFGNLIESDHDSAPSPPAVSIEKSTMDSRALVPIPVPKTEPLAVIPVRKSKRSDVAQRRIRRPFSVSEVEALVQAVEKLGTGRWRDVKLRAFDNAKHRTYVDLKDKWKTLVHTARISPQQRRGEPVPQELLDRVLTAHAYWSQQQAKQQIKQQTEACLLL